MTSVSLYIAFIIAAADGLPPLRPVFVICGIFVDARSFFDSTAEIKPTGMPTIRAGLHTFSFTIFIKKSSNH